MLEITTSEALALSKLLQMEITSVAIAKTTKKQVSDNELQSIIDTGIKASELRIKGLQQFITDNDLHVSEGGYY